MYQPKKNSYKIVFGSGQTLVGVTTLRRVITEGWTSSHEDGYYATIEYDQKDFVFPNTTFTIFDLGNHPAFLDRFVGELSEFIFTAVRVLVFVVDAINIRNLGRVRYYFEKMISHLHTYSPDAKVFIFVNKWDLVPPNLKGEVYNEIRKYLLASIDPSYQQSNIRIYKTSVFHFRKTLVRPILDLFSTTLTGEFL